MAAHIMKNPVLHYGHLETLNRALERVAAVAVVPGRFLLAGIFLSAAFGKITGWEGTAGYMAAHGMPLIPLLLPAAIALELGGGLALLLGFNTRLAALALFSFLVPTTLIFHNFWALTGADQAMQLTMFMKNLSIMGGLLMVFALGGGRYSLDARGEKKVRT